MAGKLHINYDAYNTSNKAAIAISPFSKLAKAYSQGYRSAPVQLGGDPVAAAAYNQGVTDKTNSKPPTHTG